MKKKLQTQVHLKILSAKYMCRVFFICWSGEWHVVLEFSNFTQPYEAGILHRAVFGVAYVDVVAL